MGVKQERSGWRDEGISRRHRAYGTLCYAVDMDFVLVEYTARNNKIKVAAIVEYKNEQAAPQYESQANVQAIKWLADKAQVPFIACRYTNDFKIMKLAALNDCALLYIPERRKEVSEIEYVRLLYRMRGMECPQGVIDGLYKEF